MCAAGVRWKLPVPMKNRSDLLIPLNEFDFLVVNYNKNSTGGGENMWGTNRDPWDAYHRAVEESKNRIKNDEFKALLRRQTEKRRIARLPNCPTCGEKCEYNSTHCLGCNQELVWAEYLVGVPGDEARLQQQLTMDEKKYHKRREKRRAIRKKYAERNSRLESQQLIIFLVLLTIAIVGLFFLWPHLKLYLP